MRSFARFVKTNSISDEMKSQIKEELIYSEYQAEITALYNRDK